MARFRVDHCFELESRRLFVLAGEILEGDVAVGMTLSRETADGVVPISCIEAIEYLTFVERKPAAEVALCLTYASEDELDVFRASQLASCEIVAH
jgi:hypothetical protein